MGLDGFTYAADDGTVSVPAAVVLTVTNTPPVANDDNYSTKEGTTLSVGRPGVLKNDQDADGDHLRTKLVDGPNHGSLELEDRGDFDYVPDDGFVGTDSFTYRASDGADLVGAREGDDRGPAADPADAVAIAHRAAEPHAYATPNPDTAADPEPDRAADPLADTRPNGQPHADARPDPDADGRRPIGRPIRPTGPSRPRHPPRTRAPAPTIRARRDRWADPPRAPAAGLTADRGARTANPGKARSPIRDTPTGQRLGLGRPATSDMSNASIAFDAGVAAAFDGFSWQVPALVLSVPGLLVVVAVFLQVVGGLAWLPVIRRRLGGDGLTPPDRRP